jgi:hypothetical protein
MHLGTIDYAIVAAYFALIIGMGLYFGRKAKRSMLDYFLSHRSMPWWLAGTAMVATTFSADTPLAVTEMVHHGRGDLSQPASDRDLRRSAGGFGDGAGRGDAAGERGERSADDADGTQIEPSFSLRTNVKLSS